ncbi:MAG: hypothetical protein IPM79_37010 [Polyangiaceae bacterium]|nr:hypothetical protein [Polyangiaceae bacterium]
MATGAYGHLGVSALQTATALRAKCLEPSGAPFVDREGDRVGIARALAIGVDVRGKERLAALAAPALREAAAGCRGPWPAFVALPSAARPDAMDSTAAAAWLSEVATKAGVAIQLDASRCFPSGHSGFAEALAAAEAWAAGRGDVTMFVGGVDSPFDASVVSFFDERGWVAKEDRDGARIPAEAAAFVRLERTTRRARGKGKPRLAAVEAAAPEGSTPGRLLGKLMRRVARAPASGSLSWLLPDLNGEPYRMNAFHEASTDSLDLLQGVVLDELAQHTGDTGAATGALLTVMAVELQAMGAARSESAAILAVSDEGDAGVVVWDLPERLLAAAQETRGELLASIGEVRRHALGGARGALSPSEAERSQMAARARGLLDDIGSMGVLLGPDPENDQDDMSAFAQRMLDAYDALSALGVGRPGAPYLDDLGALVDAYATATLTPNRARRFAVGFVRAQLGPALMGATRSGKRTASRGRSSAPRRA